MWVISGGINDNGVSDFILIKKNDGIWFPAPVSVPFPIYSHTQVKRQSWILIFYKTTSA